MNRLQRCVREIAKGAVLGAGMLLSAASEALAAEQPSRPNILFILSDDHALQAIGAYDARLSQFCREQGATPNIDRLAAQGALFRNSFCASSLCSPSRATILTGMFPHVHNVKRLSSPIAPGVWTFPQAMRDAGYETALVGKWHLGNRPEEMGLDYWQYTEGQGGTYWNSDFVGPAGKQRRDGHITEVTTNLGLDWLRERQSDKPFMLMLQHKAPHRPWMPSSRHYDWLKDVQVPEPATLFDDYTGRASPASHQAMRMSDLKMGHDLKAFAANEWPGPYSRMTGEQRAAWDAHYRPRNESFATAGLQGQELFRWQYQQYVKDYLRCVKDVDDSVGQIMDYLRESGLEQNTVLIYSSDQGFYTGEHGWFDKRWIYEESLHMPFVIRWPGVVQAGSRPDAMIQNIDYAPTLMEIAGGKTPEGLHGRSMLPILRGQAPGDWRQSVYYHYYYDAPDHNVPKHEGVRTARYTLAHFYVTGEWELYDLEKDPQQLRSVYSDPAYAAVVAELKNELQRLRVQYAVPESDYSAAAEKTPQSSAIASR